MRRFLVFVVIFLIIFTILENLRTKAKLQIEPVEQFERERFLWRTKLNGRAALDANPINR